MKIYWKVKRQSSINQKIKIIENFCKTFWATTLKLYKILKQMISLIKKSCYKVSRIAIKVGAAVSTVVKTTYHTYLKEKLSLSVK